MEVACARVSVCVSVSVIACAGIKLVWFLLSRQLGITSEE